MNPLGVESIRAKAEHMRHTREDVLALCDEVDRLREALAERDAVLRQMVATRNSPGDNRLRALAAARALLGADDG